MLGGRRCRRRRKGAALVEAAVVLPVFFALLLGGVTLGLKLFHRQERGHLAQGLTRWASLQDPASMTPEQIRARIPAANTAGLDPANMEITSTRSSDGSTTVTIKYPKPTDTTPPLFVVRKKVWNPY